MRSDGKNLKPDISMRGKKCIFWEKKRYTRGACNLLIQKYDIHVHINTQVRQVPSQMRILEIRTMLWDNENLNIKYRNIFRNNPLEATLKKSCFWWSGRVSILPRTGNFFVCGHFCNVFVVKNCIIFFHKKRGFCGHPTDHNFSHPLDRKQTFFKSGLTA